MVKGSLCVLALMSFTLFAQDRSRSFDHIQSDVNDLRERLRHAKVERELLQDQLHNQTSELESLKKEFTRQQDKQASASKVEQLQARVNSLEKTQEILLEDLKQLKKHFNETAGALNHLSDHSEQNQVTMKGQVQELKKAIESLVGLLQKPGASPSKGYRVKPGDNLEKIARTQGVSVDLLKKLNNLGSDRITIGQELQLP